MHGATCLSGVCPRRSLSVRSMAHGGREKTGLKVSLPRSATVPQGNAHPFRQGNHIEPGHLETLMSRVGKPAMQAPQRWRSELRLSSPSELAQSGPGASSAARVPKVIQKRQQSLFPSHKHPVSSLPGGHALSLIPLPVPQQKAQAVQDADFHASQFRHLP